ncbi:hypothetical protein NIA69_23370 [Gemmiger formicilis]|nr:hypothetical protein [Gemmiger formicilis]
MAYEFNHYYELQNVATGKYVNVLGNHEDGTVKMVKQSTFLAVQTILISAGRWKISAAMAMFELFCSGVKDGTR